MKFEKKFCVVAGFDDNMLKFVAHYRSPLFDDFIECRDAAASYKSKHEKEKVAVYVVDVPVGMPDVICKKRPVCFIDGTTSLMTKWFDYDTQEWHEIPLVAENGG